MNLNTREALKSLGLHPSEIKVFLFLLQSGRSTIKNVSRGTLIGRTNCYYVVRELLSKKLIVKNMVNNEVAFEISDPKVILDYAKNLEAKAKEAVPGLEAAFYSGPAKIQSVYLNSPDDIEHLFCTILSTSKPIYFGPKPEDPGALKSFIEDRFTKHKSAKVFYNDRVQTYFFLFNNKVALFPISITPSATVLQNKELRTSIEEMINVSRETLK